MKKGVFIAILALLLMPGLFASAQKQVFDVISFVPPKDWQQQQSEGGIQLSVTNKKTGEYAIAVIVKAIPSAASASENFNNQWAICHQFYRLDRLSI